MPIFEYRCRSCRRRTTSLVLVRSRETDVRCQWCGSADLEKLFSRFATPRSEDARLDALADSSAFADADEDDPRSVMRAMQRMGQELGEDTAELEEAFEQDLADSPGEEPGGTGSSADDE